MTNLQKHIEDGGATDVLLGIGRFYVPSRFLKGHDYLLALYWLNQAARQSQDPRRFSSEIERAFDFLLADKQYENAANFITALWASRSQDHWVIPISFSTYARKFQPYLNSVSISPDFRALVERFTALSGLDGTVEPS